MKHQKLTGIKTMLADQESFYTIHSAVDGEKKGFYFLSNDVYDYKLKAKDGDSRYVFMGIANPHYFHILAQVSTHYNVIRLIAIDNNFAQLRHFDYIKEVICSSSNRIEYLQNLFKVIFNATAITLLNKFNEHPRNYIHGGAENDGFYALEKTLWRNLTFDQDLFSQTYGLDVSLTEAGLRIESSTIGDIQTYIATILCCSRNDYRYWPFTAAFGSGFLRSEEAFRKIRKILLTIPTYQIVGEVAELYESLLISHRYSPIVFYASNLFCEYFINKNSSLKKVMDISADLGTRTEPYYPEIDLMVIQDVRSSAPLPKEISLPRKSRRELSIHTKSFIKVVSFLQGAKNIEVVNMASWIEHDKGESKLPNADYMLSEEFNKLDSSHRFTSVFLHILVGHGMELSEFYKTVRKALSATNNLIILEHNRESRDFKNKGIGLSIDDLRNNIGMESFLTFCPGERCEDRNILTVYRREAVVSLPDD